MKEHLRSLPGNRRNGCVLAFSANRGNLLQPHRLALSLFMTARADSTASNPPKTPFHSPILLLHALRVAALHLHLSVVVFHSCQRLLVTCLLPLQLFVGPLLFIGTPPLSQAAENREERSRFCSFLYCRETKGGATSTQAFLYLYSTEERGSYSRLTLFPWYSREMNPAEDYLRQSVLWPLGISERKG